MKILLYSDLHLEFGNDFAPPKDLEADVMILAGDIITFKDFEPLKRFLADWKKPVLFVAGNHEYYTKQSMAECDKNFLHYLDKNFSPEQFLNFIWLRNHGCEFEDISFFGGTMWTNFAHSPLAMMHAKRDMADYRYIFKNKTQKLWPEDTVKFHKEFKEKLIAWLEENKDKKRVIISHHAPCLNPNSQFKDSILQPAFNSLEMVDVIEKYQPDLWVYGHTHECDDQMIGKTRIVSNQFGYYKQEECKQFNPNFVIELCHL